LFAFPVYSKKARKLLLLRGCEWRTSYMALLFDISLDGLTADIACCAQKIGMDLEVDKSIQNVEINGLIHIGFPMKPGASTHQW